jgi:hypothetical protein
MAVNLKERLRVRDVERIQCKANHVSSVSVYPERRLRVILAFLVAKHKDKLWQTHLQLCPPQSHSNPGPVFHHYLAPFSAHSSLCT